MDWLQAWKNLWASAFPEPPPLRWNEGPDAEDGEPIEVVNLDGSVVTGTALHFEDPVFPELDPPVIQATPETIRDLAWKFGTLVTHYGDCL